MTPHIRKPFDRERSITQFEGESKVDNSFGNDTNINHIIARFTRTGILPTPTTEPQYGDVTHLQKDLTQLIDEGRSAAARAREAIQQQQRDAKEKQSQETQKLMQRVKELEALQAQSTAPDSSSGQP